MEDFLRMNDWPIRRFIVVSFSLLVILNSIIILENIGITLFFIRQIVGIIILTFIPGYAILRILRIHNLSRIKSFMFSIGLSLSYIMIMGLFLKLLNIYFEFFFISYSKISIKFYGLINSSIILIIISIYNFYISTA